MIVLLCCTARVADPAVTLLRELDRDGSGRLERGEVPAREFGPADADHDGGIDLDELRAAMERPGP
jgi:Ca2+-binding EF-hand superfamily protein